MKTEYPGVDWLLDCEPRLVQLEALARSYTGYIYRDRRDDAPVAHPLPHEGHPAVGWGHFMEMRLGKTPTLLNEWLLFRRDHGIRKGLILAPNKYKNTWALEAEKFGLIDVPLCVFDSQRRRDVASFMSKGEGLLFINYEALISDKNMALLTEWVDNRTYIGADESVFLKNRKAQITERAKILSNECAVIRPMTGKPTPQGVGDLYSQLRFMRHIEGWNFYQFRNRFAIMGGFQGKKIVGVKNEDKLHELTRRCFFFARRADWGTNIDSDYETVEIDMLDAQKKAYKDMEEEFVVWLESGEEITADQVTTKHIKLQQISSGFILDEFRTPHMLVPFEKTPKFLDLRDRLDNYETNKVLIIAHYNATLDFLFEHLQDYNPAIIRGNRIMKILDRDVDEEKLRFNTDPKCRILLGQEKAVKYGHTLMGVPEDPCLTTIYFENSYSLDDRSQTEQRNQGEGQLAPINIVDYVSSGAEAAIVEALQRKEQVAGVIMGYYKQLARKSQ